MPVLIALAGLPGTGKTSVAQRLCLLRPCVFLRIDVIEAALAIDDPQREIGGLGYRIAAGLATSNLKLSRDVVIDCVNPWPLTRMMFQDAAHAAGARHFGVELTCSDRAAHRHRVETRRADLVGMDLPDWPAVVARDYRPWDGADLHVDTAVLTAREAAATIADARV